MSSPGAGLAVGNPWVSSVRHTPPADMRTVSVGSVCRWQQPSPTNKTCAHAYKVVFTHTHTHTPIDTHTHTHTHTHRYLQTQACWMSWVFTLLLAPQGHFNIHGYKMKEENNVRLMRDEGRNGEGWRSGRQRETGDKEPNGEGGENQTNNRINVTADENRILQSFFRAVLWRSLSFFFVRLELWCFPATRWTLNIHDTRSRETGVRCWHTDALTRRTHKRTQTPTTHLCLARRSHRSHQGCRKHHSARKL